MKYREEYAKKTAVRMYQQGRNQADAVQMLREEGADGQADSLAKAYHADYLVVQAHYRQQKHKAAS